MKKTLSILLTFLCGMGTAFCQSGPGMTTTSEEKIIRDAQNLKTGNNLDVLTSFFQIALQDLGGEDKSFAFKSTLFGIKARADSTLLIDTNFKKQRNARNLQFEVALHTTNSFRPAGISGGILYALVNNRDKQSLDLRDDPFRVIDSIYKKARKDADIEAGDERYNKAQREAIDSLVKELKEEYDPLLMPVIKQFESDKDVSKLPKEYQNRFRTIRKDLLKSEDSKAESAGQVYNRDGDESKLPASVQATYKKYQVSDKYQASKQAYDSGLANWAARGLLTAGVYGRTDSSSSHFREASLQTVYLKGLGSRRIEADLRATLSCKDTLSPDKGLRYGFHFLGGANFIAIQSRKSKKSLLELKPNVEFRSLLSKQFAGEENFFSFNMDVRIRITDQIWIPFIVKYDVDKKNFLGFLNVSANLDAFRNALKS